MCRIFYTPSEIDKSDIIINKTIRIGGFVENNSFNKISSSSFKFKITDEKASILLFSMEFFLIYLEKGKAQ